MIGLVLLLGFALAALAALLTRPLAGVDAGVHELERAFRRSRRPLPAGLTLGQLEQALRRSPEAAAYVERLRTSRFSGVQRLPSGSQRRALREQLAAGLGLLGKLRALWALPPRRRARSPSGAA